MYQFKVKFGATSTGIPAPICSSGTILYIDLVDGYPKYTVNGVSLDVAEFEVFVSEGTTGAFTIVGDDGSSNDEVDQAILLAAPPTDTGTVTPTRDTRDNLVLAFTPPANEGTVHIWTFGTDTPAVVLKVKVKRQQSPNSGDCSTWPSITIS